MAYMYVQKRRNRIGFLRNKEHFMNQFSSPTIKMIVWNNGKVWCPRLSQPDGFDGTKGRINGSPLQQRRHLLLKKSSYWSSVAAKEPMLKQSMPLPETRLELRLYLCSCCDSDDPCENACGDTNTLQIENEDSDSEVQKDQKVEIC